MNNREDVQEPNQADLQIAVEESAAPVRYFDCTGSTPARSDPPHPRNPSLSPHAQGLRVALFFTRTHARLLRPKLADIFDPAPRFSTPLRKAFDRVDQEIKRCCLELKLAA
jgi:hypothetical protein